MTKSWQNADLSIFPANQKYSANRKRGLAIVSLDPGSITGNFRCRGWRRKLAFYTRSLDLPRYRRRGAWDLLATTFRDHPTYVRLDMVYSHVYQIFSKQELQNLVKAEDAHVLGQLLPALPQPLTARRLQRYLYLLELMASQGYSRELAPDYIGLALGREGQPIKVSEGNHRLAAAQILGLASIEAEVRYVHEKWYQTMVQAQGYSAGPEGICRALADLEIFSQVENTSSWGNANLFIG